MSKIQQPVEVRKVDIGSYPIIYNDTLGMVP